MKRLLNLELTLVSVAVVFTFTGLSVLGQQREVVIDSYPPVTTVEQGESIVLVCRVVGVLPSVTPSYSWTCKNGDPCEGTEVVSGNRLRIGVLNSGNHGVTFTCRVTGSGLSVSGAFSLTVNDGLALSAGGTNFINSFIPRDSFITDSSLITSSESSSVVACRSTNGNPMWYYPNGTVVTTEERFNVYQTAKTHRSDLVIGNVATSTNGDYTCTGTFTGPSGSISTELGLYIGSATSLDPPTSLMSGDVDASSIVVMWSGAGSPVNGYYISWRRTDLGDSATAEYAQVTGATMYMLTNLFAGVTYNITVWSTDDTQVSSSVSRQVTTMESAPTAPRLLRVVDSSSCQLDWLPPAEPNGAVTYTVQYQTSGSFMGSTPGLTTTHHSAVNLPSGTSVTVRVQAVNTAGFGTSTSNTVVLQVPVLPQPLSPMAVLTSPNNITVSWSAPPAVDCPTIDDYIVVYNDGTSNTTVPSSTSPVTLPNLQHGTTYSLLVAARSEGVSGMSVATNPPNITTLLAAPVFGTLSPKSTSVQLTWSPVTPGSVQSYRLNITGGGTPQTATVLVPGTDHMFSGLTPFTEYTVTITAVDTMNREGVMTTRRVTTDMSAPSVPRELKVNTTSGLSVTLRWDPPAVLGDTSVNYIIGYVGASTLFTTPDTTFEVTGLSPSTTFNFSVKANNSVGTSAPVYVVAMTTDAPPPVTVVNTSPAETNTSVTVSWSQADNPDNGTVTGYQLTVVILRATDNTTDSEVVVDGGSTTTTTISSLVPGVPYFVEVRVNESVRGLGLPRVSSVFFSQEKDADPRVQVSNLNYDMDNNRLSWIPIPLFEARHFFNYTITAMPSSSSTQKRQNSPTMIVPYSKCSDVCSVQLSLSPNTNYSVTVAITRSTNVGETTLILVFLTPTTPVTPVREEVVIATSVGVVGGVIVAILIAVLVILCVCFLVRNKNSDYKLGRGGAVPYGVTNGNRTFNSSENLLQMSNLLTDEEREEKVREHTRTILLEDFPNYVRDMHKDRDAGFEEEYKLFRTDLVSKADVAQTHTHKNRYGNIFAYDHCRVVLKSPDEEEIDYINASYIHGYQQSNAYIATQGPIPTSIDDFWQMVWEQKSPVIVMLTKLEEGGRRKCEQYWPEDKSVPQVNDRGVKVTLVGLQHFADFDIREFHVSNEKKPEEPLLEVKHFLYTVWPDHGVPQYATSLIKFIRRVRKSYPTSKDPVVVHCSAGVGRSGTFISLDVMLQRMNAESNFNVFEFVTSMRNNRTFMVQTLDQYIFIHDAIEELIVCGDTSIPASSMRIKVNKLHHKLPNQDKTVFEHQFELLQSVSHKPINAQISDALADYNKPKNRSEEYIPYNLSRPRLLAMGIHNGADYINASYVDAYKEQNYFILTQSPLQNTINEFWLMVWQAKSSCLVMLCDQGAGEPKSCVQYWPEKVKSEELYGKVYVSFTSEEQTEGYTTRKFELVDEGKVASPIRVTMLQYKWPEDGCPSNHKPLLKLINNAERIQQATGNNPIVVMCQDGTGLSGAFAQIISQIERMKVEGLVDFFQSIKLSRLQRAHLVYSLELYIFCHEFLLSYLDSFEGYSNFEVKPAKK